jgi:hypothetical protein
MPFCIAKCPLLTHSGQSFSDAQFKIWNKSQTTASQMATDEIAAAQSNPRRPI